MILAILKAAELVSTWRSTVLLLPLQLDFLLTMYVIGKYFRWEWDYLTGKQPKVVSPEVSTLG